MRNKARDAQEAETEREQAGGGRLFVWGQIFGGVGFGGVRVR